MINLRRNKRGGQIKFLVSIVLLALFAISITTFAINFAGDNDTTVNLGDDDDFVTLKGDLQQNITKFYSDVNVSKKAFEESTISSQTESTEGGTAFKVTPATSPILVYSILRLGFKKIFGSDTGFGIFLTALIATVGFIGFMLAYKAWAGREPE